jgi:hypothetical protein
MAATDPTPRSGGSPLSARDARTAADWRRSTYSQGADSTCVEVAFDRQRATVRDSEHPAGPVLTFSLDEWRAFLLGVRAGEFEPPDEAHRSSASRSDSSSRERSGPAATRDDSASASE